MLKSLHISNYALINKLDVDFEKGFSIITGETGAGKSILLGAIALVLGQRTDTSVLKNQEENCIVEASFEIGAYQLQSFFADNELDYDSLLVIRRVINPSGKSRAFINDLPVTLNILKDLSTYLIDVHSQHNNLLIHEDEFQMDVVDSYAKTSIEKIAYLQVYESFKKTERTLQKLMQESHDAGRELEYNLHLFHELKIADFHEDEQDELEKELDALAHAEEIKANLAQAAFLLSGDEVNIIGMLKEAVVKIEQVAEYLPKGEEYLQRLQSAYIDLGDIAQELDSKAQDAEYDPDRTNWVNHRLDLIYSLEKRHHVKTIKELLDIQEELSRKVSFSENVDFELEELKKELAKQEKQLKEEANKLSDKRKKALPELEKTIVKSLQDLGMPNAQFKVALTPLPNYEKQGNDRISFTFSANRSIELQAISKVASGGEISRLMLSIKWLLSHSKALPTIVFDEIDTGVSGDIADKMGNIMVDMARSMQVITITHLPQIAGKGSVHFKVYKEDIKDITTTGLRVLSADERITEIAKMLSGKEISNAALETARILISQNS